MSELLETRLGDILKQAEKIGGCPQTIRRLERWGGNTIGYFLTEDGGSGGNCPEFLAYWYALNLAKKRVPECEDIIRYHPSYAFWYARDVIGGRWPEVEDVIKRNPILWRDYQPLMERKQ